MIFKFKTTCEQTMAHGNAEDCIKRLRMLTEGNFGNVLGGHFLKVCWNLEYEWGAPELAEKFASKFKRPFLYGNSAERETSFLASPDETCDEACELDKFAMIAKMYKPLTPCWVEDVRLAVVKDTALELQGFLKQEINCTPRSRSVKAADRLLALAGKLAENPEGIEEWLTASKKAIDNHAAYIQK
jgi:hypothetical protein